MPADARWQKIEALFDEALRHAPGDRRAWLAEECTDDDLRREVEDMVLAHDRTRGILDPPVEGVADAGLEDAVPAAAELSSENPPTEVRIGTPLHPTQVGPYRLLRRIGEGGMGVIYQAYDPRLDRDVALKFLPSHLTEPTMVARFRTEAKAASALDHPNICTVYDIGETTDGRYYIAMAYYPGENLAERITRGPLDVDEAVTLGLQAAAGLARAHEAGIVHRDIKPANLAVSERPGPDQLKILDFGVAKLENNELTDTGVIPGTLVYMPPEQLEGADADPRGDLWSLGVVLYEMLTGEAPFRGLHHAAVIHAILQQEPAPLRALRPEVPSSLERLISKALCKDPEDRHASGEELIAELESVRRELAPTADMSPLLMTLVTADLAGEAPSPKSNGGRQIGEGQWLFERPWNAVRWALACHRATGEAAVGEAGGTRIGIHLTEISRTEDGEVQTHPAALDLAARLLALTAERQTLLTRNAFDLARQTADGEVTWLAHGAYRLEGVDEPIEIFEAGEPGVAPLTAPGDSPQGRREAPGDTILGWRPAAGQEIALRPGWRLERKIGEGGFGEVWLAVYSKTGERRAFKFCLEARRLRALKREITLFRLLKVELGERSDIARILDWNLDTAPFFIESEYSEDGNLVEWAAEQGGLDQVPLDIRLKIIGQVAEALAVAHSVGVLHKDIKPSNILIRSDSRGQPRPQLADFGIGLLTEPERLEGAGITLTEDSSVGQDSSDGTPMYRAPELLEGKPATVGADVYALGVMLYQMIVGDLSKALGSGWERDVDDELLREDVAEAVDGSPRRRLGDALGLAKRLEMLDQRRQQRDAERRAREEAERTRAELERSRRRRRALAAGMTILTLFVGILGWQVRRADREATRANREAETARQVADFLVRVFEISDPGSDSGSENSRELTARQVLDSGSKLVHSQLRDQPEVRARLLRTIGVVYRSLGYYEPAGELLENALAARREIWPQDHPELAESLDDLAELARLEGDYERGEALARQALEMCRRLTRGDHLDTATSLSTLALVHLDRDDDQAAEPLFVEVLDMRRRLLGEDHPKVARSLHNLGAMFAKRGDFDNAERFYRQALATHRQVSGDGSPDMVMTLNNLASFYYRKRDYAAGVPLAHEAVELNRRFLGDRHPVLASSLNIYALLLSGQGDREAAGPLYREALTIRRHVLNPDHPALTSSLLGLGRFLQKSRDFEAAEELFREASRIRQRVYGKDHPKTAAVARYLAELELERRDLETDE